MSTSGARDDASKPPPLSNDEFLAKLKALQKPSAGANSYYICTDILRTDTLYRYIIYYVVLYVTYRYIMYRDVRSSRSRLPVLILFEMYMYNVTRNVYVTHNMKGYKIGNMKCIWNM